MKLNIKNFANKIKKTYFSDTDTEGIIRLRDLWYCNNYGSEFLEKIRKVIDCKNHNQ